MTRLAIVRHASGADTIFSAYPAEVVNTADPNKTLPPPLWRVLFSAWLLGACDAPDVPIDSRILLRIAAESLKQDPSPFRVVLYCDADGENSVTPT